MNFWLKAATVIGAGICVWSFLALSGLAERTTQAEQRQGVIPQCEQGQKADPAAEETSAALQMLSSLLPQMTEEAREMAERLRLINQNAGVVPNELVIAFKTPDALADFRARAGDEGLEVVNADPRLLTARVRYSDAEAMARELANHAEDYDNVGPNYLIWVPGISEEIQQDASNAGGREPYGNSGLGTIGATGDRTTWGKDVTVAVLDTGITAHASIDHAPIVHYDLVKDGEEPNGHGTAMASLIAGSGAEDGGPAPASRLLDIRVADVNGESNTALVAQGIMEAVDRGARLINISLGTTADSAVLARAVAYALGKGVVIVAAAGNDRHSALAYPAAYQGVISVGAVDAAGVQAYFSNSGKTLTISAPGVGIVSAYSGGRTVVSSGTSQATAITSGVVATLLGRRYSSGDIARVLAQSARSTGALKEQVGAGVVRVPK